MNWTESLTWLLMDRYTFVSIDPSSAPEKIYEQLVKFDPEVAAHDRQSVIATIKRWCDAR